VWGAVVRDPWSMVHGRRAGRDCRAESGWTELETRILLKPANEARMCSEWRMELRSPRPTIKDFEVVASRPTPGSANSRNPQPRWTVVAREIIALRKPQQVETRMTRTGRTERITPTAFGVWRDGLDGPNPRLVAVRVSVLVRVLTSVQPDSAHDTRPARPLRTTDHGPKTSRSPAFSARFRAGPVLPRSTGAWPRRNR